MRPILLSALVALALAPGIAGADVARNSLQVRPSGPDSFEVPYRGLSGPRDFWCVAGDYVRNELNLPGTTRIYRTSSPPRRAGYGMTFSLSPEGAKPTGLLMLTAERGITSAHARLLCDRSIDG